ncbi:MAG: hypothetical protein ACR2OA_03450 [Rubripirellula sp.]|jgi:hypothetical protein
MTNKPTANELRALVAELKPRSPQEVMGAAASSSLTASLFTAALTGIGLLFCATFLMFFLGFGPTPSADAAKSGTAQATESASDNNAPGAEADVDTEQNPSAGDANVEAMANDNRGSRSEPAGSTDTAVEAMGIGEAAEPDSKPESLENRLDRILEGLE